MATNYSMLKESEAELMHNFNDYFRSSIDIFDKLYKGTMVDKKTSDTLMSEIHELEKGSDIRYVDLKADCIWIIQKDQPSASHLRFIIAIITSLKDVERMFDHAYSIAKFIIKHQKDKKVISFLEPLCWKSLESKKEIYKLFITTNAEEAKAKVEKIQMTFYREYKKSILEAIALIRKDSTSENVSSGLIIVLKNIERDIDHCDNIVSNFSYINR